MNNPKKSATPRTDATIRIIHNAGQADEMEVVPIVHARQPETELHRLRSQQMTMRNALLQVMRSGGGDSVKAIAGAGLAGTSLILSDTEIRLGEALEYLHGPPVFKFDNPPDKMMVEINSVLLEFAGRMQATQQTRNA